MSSPALPRVRREPSSAFVLTPRRPIVAKWGTVRFDVWEHDKIVGGIWDWQPGVAGERRWSAEACHRNGARIAMSRGVELRSELEARAWLVRWWAERRGVKPVGL